MITNERDFYEQVARDNKVCDTPETLRLLREQWLPKNYPELGDSNESKLNFIKYHLIDTILCLREHESGMGKMSDFALIHNLGVGLSELVFNIFNV